MIVFSDFSEQQSKEVEYIKVPVLDRKVPEGYRLEKQPIILPHRIMSYLFNEVNLDIPKAGLHSFWEASHLRGDPVASDLALVRDRVPLGLYGDAAQLVTRYKKEKIMCLWLNIPCWRPKSVRFSRFLMWSCDDGLILENKTVNSVLRWIVWSCNILYDGINPTYAPGGRLLNAKNLERSGTPITWDNRQFCVAELRGDWEFHKMVWNFKCSWKSIDICFRCPAVSKSDNDAGKLYWNCQEGCSWEQQKFSTAQFISQRLPDRHICYLHSI